MQARAIRATPSRLSHALPQHDHATLRAEPMRIPHAVMRASVRHRHRLPHRVVAAALDLASLLPATTPLRLLPHIARALVIAPHPDDESIGCGGVAAMLARRGCSVRVMLATDGEATLGGRHPGATAARRRAEASVACRRLGATLDACLCLPDGRLEHCITSLAESLDAVISRVAPELILTPWLLDDHPDHRAILAALAQVPPRDIAIWGYEVHTPIPVPDRIIDITKVLPRKRSALSAHTTAAIALDLDAIAALGRWRASGAHRDDAAAEAFLTMPWPDLPMLVEVAHAAWPLPSDSMSNRPTLTTRPVRAPRAEETTAH